MPGPMTVCGALNLNARNFDVELRRAQEKLENGMSGFLTQPVLSEPAVQNLQQARQTLGPEAKILAGILPVVSQRNAIFMENEVNGIHVDAAIIDRLIQKEDKKESELAKDERTNHEQAFRSQLPKMEKTEFYVDVQALGEQTLPVIITQSEYMRRMKEAS